MSVALRPLCLSIVLLALAPALEAQTETAAPDRAQLEQQFVERMTGARLIGKFTVVTPQGEQSPQGDEYAISELVRGETEGEWIFRYTMSYGGGQKMTVPIPVRVVWAGDTPVLTMTNQAVEGLGIFSVRLLLYDGYYAGTWSNGPIGGHMWGRIETDAESAAAPDNGSASR